MLYKSVCVVTEWLCFTSVHPLHIIDNLPAVTISLFPFVMFVRQIAVGHCTNTQFYVSVLHVLYENVMDTKSTVISVLVQTRSLVGTRRITVTSTSVHNMATVSAFIQNYFATA